MAEARWYGSESLGGMANHVDNHIHSDMIEAVLFVAACYRVSRRQFASPGTSRQQWEP
jgi:hypothetical protein